MQVVIVVDGSSRTGGQEKVAIGSALAWARSGVSTGFFGAEGELDPCLRGVPNLRAESLGLTDAYHTESKQEILSRFFTNEAAATSFREFLLHFDPEDTVVHFHGFRRIHSISVPMVAWDQNFATVYTHHDFGLACPATAFYSFTEEAICHRKPMGLACWTHQCTKGGLPMKGMVMARAKLLKKRRAAFRFDHHIHVSEFAHRILAPYLSDDPSTVVPNPIEIDRGVPAEPGGHDGFLFVGRMQKEKDGITLARAAKAANVAVTFVGDGPEREAIQREYPRARFTGWLSPDQVQQEMRSCRALVLPSRWYETAGLGVLEALAQGVPAIVANSSAATEWVTDGLNGALFATGDVDSLTQALRRADPLTAATWGNTAYARYWADPFTESRYLNATRAIYETLVD